MNKTWREGTTAHYLDAAYYDLCYATMLDDVAYYAREATGQVLELGAGTGRITLRIARSLAAQGAGKVWGIESMTSMRARGEEKRDQEEADVQRRVEFLPGDFCDLAATLPEGARFDRIFAPFNAMMHLYTPDQIDAFLGGVRQHLKPSGEFHFDVLLPDPEAFCRDPEERFEAEEVVLPSTGHTYRYEERFDYDHFSQVQLIEMIFTRVDKPSECIITPLAHRQFFPQELRLLLRNHGFEVLRHDGGFDGDDIDETSESQVVACRLA